MLKLLLILLILKLKTMTNPYSIGKFIYLRHPTNKDVSGDWYQWLSDPEITKYMPERYWPNSLESQREFFNSLQTSKNRLVLAICDIQTDTHIGIMSLSNINWVHKSAEIAFIIGNEKFKTGSYIIEAISLMLKIAFSKLNFKNILSKHVSSHQITPLMLKRFNFKTVGRLINYVEIDNSLKDLVLDQLSLEDWKKISSN